MNKFDNKIFIKDHKIGQESKNILNNFVLNASDGWYRTRFDKIYKKASTKQFGYLYGFVYDQFAIALRQTGLFEVDDEKEVEKLCDAMFANKDLVNKQSGEIIPIPMSKSDFCTLDMMVYVDNIRDYASLNMNFIIPDPNPNWKQEKARLILKKQKVIKLLNECVSIAELDEIFPMLYDVGCEELYTLKETEIMNRKNEE